MALDATRNFGNHFTTVPTVTCRPVTGRGSIPGSELVAINDLRPDVAITAFKHLHSTNTGQDDPTAVPVANPDPASGPIACQPTRQGNTVPCNLQDPRDPSLFPAGTALTSVMNVQTATTGPGGPISLFYVFTVNGGGGEPFRFVWHNSTGDIIDSCALPNNMPGTTTPFEPGQDANGCFPGVTVNGKTVGANLAAIMESLGPVDLEMGSVVSLGFNQNGERDIVSYISHVRPHYFIPNHTTAVAVEGSALEWKVGFNDAVTAFGLPAAALPTVLWIVDPKRLPAADPVRPQHPQGVLTGRVCAARHTGGRRSPPPASPGWDVVGAAASGVHSGSIAAAGRRRHRRCARRAAGAANRSHKPVPAAVAGCSPATVRCKIAGVSRTGSFPSQAAGRSAATTREGTRVRAGGRRDT